MGNDVIHDIGKEGERFLKAINRELYENLAGLKKASDLREIYKSHSSLVDPALFYSVKDLSPKDNEEEIGLRLILNFLARSVIGGKTARVKDEILTAELREAIRINGKAIPYRSTPAEIKREPKRIIREEIDKKRREKLLKINPLVLEVMDTMHSTSAELGFSSFIELCDKIEMLNLFKLEEKAKLFLNDTEYIYRDLLKWFLLKRMELQLKDAKSYDLESLFNSFELRAYFPKEDLKALAKAFLGEMGVEVGENIKTDLEERMGKISRPFSTAIQVPENIVLVIYPIGGIEDYESFFHELGISLSYGNAEREDVFEFRRLREAASTEVFGILFRNLLLQPRWLKRYLKLDTNSDFLRFLYLKQLTIIRLYCGKLIYELALHKDEDFKGKPDLYKQTLEKATLCEQNEEDYLNDVDRFFRSASYLKASIIESELKWHLRENFDEEWWREKAAGDFINKLWKEGGRTTSVEIATKVGLKELDLTRLLGFFRQVLG
ncbi:MAG TPA: hypothetical protein VLB01_07730 [Thermodesulfobacteriota bacterium]|nr:hypothetical protein [Thermodesulfobacteriota bacterium]